MFAGSTRWNPSAPGLLSHPRAPIEATFHPYVAYIAERPADTVMHETHERDNLCHFSGERPMKRDRNENRFADTLMGLLRSVCDSRRTIQITVLRDSTEIRWTSSGKQSSGIFNRSGRTIRPCVT